MKYVPLLILWLSLSTARGQVSQLWTDINLQKRVSEYFSWSFYGGPRFQNESGLYQFYTGATGQLSFHKIFRVGCGLLYFYTRPSVHEIRPWQYLQMRLNLSSRIMFLNQARLDQRWLVKENDHNEFILRFRYLTGITFVVFQLPESKRSGYLPVTFEIFDELNKERFIYANRLDVGMGYAFARTKVELHYLAQSKRNLPGDHFSLTENIYRLRWFYVL